MSSGDALFCARCQTCSPGLKLLPLRYIIPKHMSCTCQACVERLPAQHKAAQQYPFEQPFGQDPQQMHPDTKKIPTINMHSRYLNVENNRLEALPTLEGNPRLKSLFAGSNNLKKARFRRQLEYACFCKLRVLLVAELIMGSLLFWVYVAAFCFWKLPYPEPSLQILFQRLKVIAACFDIGVDVEKDLHIDRDIHIYRSQWENLFFVFFMWSL